MSVPHDRVSQPPSTDRSSAHWNVIDWLAMVLMVIGSLNWGLVGTMDLNLVAALLGDMTVAARAVYALVGLAGLYGLVVLVKMGRSSRHT